MSAARPPLRYLAASDVLAAMPDLDERLALAERTLVALVADADLPPKIGVHPRPTGSFAHAMPAYLRGRDASGADDLLGMKWVAGFGGNAELGLPAINAVVVLNDADTGLPRAILDGGRLGGRHRALRPGHQRARAPRSSRRRRGPGTEPPGGPRSRRPGCPADRLRSPS
jgi:ornithine cyclodeaminase/alanine dehydrogenase-like protein (mu-crystallin family)